VTGQERRRATPSVAALVVDYDAGDVLLDCITSLLDEGVRVVVVENGDPAPPSAALAAAGLDGRVPLLATGKNLGYGAGPTAGPPPSTRPTTSWCATLISWSTPGRSPRWLPWPRRSRPSPSSGLASSPPRVRSTRRCAASRPFSTPPGTPPSAFCAKQPLLQALPHPRRRGLAPRGRLGVGRVLPRPAERLRGAGRLRRDLLHVQRGHGHLLAGPPGGLGVGVEPAAVVTHLEGVSRRRHPTPCSSPTTARPSSLPTAPRPAGGGCCFRGRPHPGRSPARCLWPPGARPTRLRHATVPHRASPAQ